MKSPRKTSAALRARSRVEGYIPTWRLHKAARDGNVKQITRLLLPGACHVNDVDKENRTPLHYACAYGQAEVVVVLVKKNCNLNLYDSDSNTPLIKAFQYQEEECITLLLENGADPNVQDAKGETPLHHVVYADNISIAAKLLLYNIDLEAPNKDGHTPLLLALKENKHHVAEFLMKSKANIHAVDKRGRTALMLAVRYESPGIIKLLIEGGIDVFAEDQDGGTALDYSVSSGCNMKMIFDCTRAKPKIRANIKKVDESSQDDPLIRCSDKTGPSDSMPDEGSNQSDIKQSFSESFLQKRFDHVFKPIQPTTGMRDSLATKEVEMRDVRTLTSEPHSDVKTKKGGEALHGRKKKRAKHVSGGANGGGEEKRKEYVEDVGPMSSHMAGSQIDNVAKPQDTSKDSVPTPSTVSRGIFPDFEPTTAMQDSLAKKSAGMKNMRTLYSEQYSDVETKKGGEALHGRNKKWAKHLSGDANGGEEKRKEYVEDVVPMFSTMDGSRSIDLNEPKDTSTDSVPMSPTEPQSDVETKKGGEALHGRKKKRAKHVSGGANGGGDEKRKEHVEDVVPMSSPMDGSRSIDQTEPKDTSTDSVPMSPTEPHSDVETEKGGETGHGHKKMWAKHMSGSAIGGGEEKRKEYVEAEPDSNVTPEEVAETPHCTEKMQAKHLSGDANQGGEEKIEEYVEDVVPMSSPMAESRSINMAEPEDTSMDSVSMSSTAEPHVEVTPEKGQKSLDGKEKKKSKGCFGSLLKMFHIHSSKNLHGGANQRREQKVKGRSIYVEEPSLKVRTGEKKKMLDGPENKQPQAKKQINATEDLDESQTPLTALPASKVACPNYMDICMLDEPPSMSSKDSHSLPELKNAVDSCQTIVELEKSHCSQCLFHMKEVTKLENKLCVQKEELLEVENAKSMLEQTEIKWKEELCSLRHDLKEQEKKLIDFEQLWERTNNQLRETEGKYKKEVELNKELQLSSRKLKTEVETARSNLNQVSTGNETEKELLHKYHILHDEFTVMRLEMEKTKCQNQEDKKELLEVIDILREKNADLQRTITLNEETLTKTTFQYNEQINILKTEITKLKFDLENKEQNTERQETEVKSYPASQAVAPDPCDESQTSKRELEFPSQRARDGCLGTKDKENFKISKLNVGSEILSHRFSKPGIIISHREKKLFSHITRDLRKVSVALKQIQRDLKQSQSQINEMKLVYQIEQSQNYKYMEEQESRDERLSQMESAIPWLLQQFQDLYTKVCEKDGLLIQEQCNIYIQEQCNIIQINQDDAENSGVKVENNFEELTHENPHWAERSSQYKMEKCERETYTSITSQCVQNFEENNDVAMIKTRQLRMAEIQMPQQYEEFPVEEYSIQSPYRVTNSLQEVNSRFPMENQSICLPCPHCGSQFPGCPCIQLEKDSWVHNRSSSQRGNIAGPTSNPQSSCQSIEDYLAEMNDKLDRGFI